ncbi:dolichol kinase [Cylas formicarius]|uniref:dolichol kinase n=1 Tax=Cylas formicarius TaxID=197179 RepID=UPI0029589565|nr:dolichol kinase [Cylas formicarius]
MPTNAAASFSTKNNFAARPDATDGLWVLPLLPASLIVSFIRHSIIATPTYKLTVLIAVGLLCTSLAIIFYRKRNESLKTFSPCAVAVAIFVGCLFHVCLHKGWLFSLSSGVFSSLIYIKTFKFLLTSFRESFSLGEAGVIAQGAVIFIYCAIENTARHASQNSVPKSNMQISTAIIQVGLISVLLFGYTVYQFNITGAKRFYFTFAVLVIFTLLLPLQVLLDRSPLVWVLDEMLRDPALLKLIIYWGCCVGVAVVAVSHQVNRAKKASTSIRKIFHLLIVAVYLPGLAYKCSFLYLASGVSLGVFFALEVMRIQEIPPLGRRLQDGYVVFSDEKDAGPLSLTAIYLLVGCSLPLWIHPAPCDVTDSSLFSILPLLSGLLSVGVGDACASFVGSNFGKIKWKGSKKTVEGTAACVISQLGIFYLLCHTGYVPYVTEEQSLRIVTAVAVGSLVEAKTTQIDNIVLPLIYYLILI